MATEADEHQSHDGGANTPAPPSDSPPALSEPVANLLRNDRSGGITLRLRTLALSATFITILTAGLTIGATAIIDNRRASVDRRANAVLAWRQELRPGAQVPGAVLDGLDLSGVYAPGADISGTSAEKTSFNRAGLVGTRFDSSILKKASFREASMAGVSFVGADLTGATLAEADVSDADFRFADLDGADLREARLSKADFTGVDLSLTKLPTDQLTSFCWDDLTKFPDDFAPNRKLCAQHPERAPGALAEEWQMSVASAPTDQDPKNWFSTYRAGERNRVLCAGGVQQCRARSGSRCHFVD